MSRDELQKLTKPQLIDEILRLLPDNSPKPFKVSGIPEGYSTLLIIQPSGVFYQGTCMACMNGTCTRKESHT